MTGPAIGILAVASHLPERRLSNAELQRENPDWDMERLVERTGVHERPIAAAGETALDLGLAACRKLIDGGDFDRADIGAVVFCTQTPDYIMPPNACLLHGALELPADVLAFDITLACSGYVYGLAVAEGLIAAGRAGRVLLVTADTYSRLIHPQDRATRCLFGDGAAASFIGPVEGGEGIIDIRCGTVGSLGDRFMVPAGGARLKKGPATTESETDRFGNVRTAEHIHMNGFGVLAFANEYIPGAVRDILDANELGVDDLDLVIFHQASRVALDSLCRLIGVGPDKNFENLANVGNLVSASIPVALAEAASRGRLRPGSLMLLCSFGVGLSWANALIRPPAVLAVKSRKAGP